MKKLMVLMAIVSFIVISGGSALANEPSIDTLNRHAVWSNWFDNDGNRMIQLPVQGTSDEGLGRKVSVQPVDKAEMSGEHKEFGFIHETEYYDYSKDHRDSA